MIFKGTRGVKQVKCYYISMHLKYHFYHMWELNHLKTNLPSQTFIQTSNTQNWELNHS